MSAPVAPKVQAASLSAAVAGAVLYLLQQYVFRGSVPAGVESLIYLAVPGVVALVAGYLAPHQVRPGDPAPATAPQPQNREPA
jgi:ABC-type Fe3+ transport system permease subunit